jgi:hypothetical protein
MNDAHTRTDFAASPNEPSPGAYCGSLVRALFVLIAIYPLSIGPAFWLATKVPSTQPILDALYTPLGALCESSPLLQSALFFYLFGVWRLPFGC